MKIYANRLARELSLLHEKLGTAGAVTDFVLRVNDYDKELSSYLTPNTLIKLENGTVPKNHNLIKLIGKAFNIYDNHAYILFNYNQDVISHLAWIANNKIDINKANTDIKVQKIANTVKRLILDKKLKNDEYQQLLVFHALNYPGLTCSNNSHEAFRTMLFNIGLTRPQNDKLSFSSSFNQYKRVLRKTYLENDNHTLANELSLRYLCRLTFGLDHLYK